MRSYAEGRAEPTRRCVTLVKTLSHHLHSQDPDRASLKSAARAAIFIPGVFAFADNVIGDPQTTIFSAFGSFSILVLADFEGSPVRRLTAYLTLAGLGFPLIALGTVCSRSAAAAACAMAVVGFAILFSGLINRYFAAGAFAALLSFILSANVPAPTAAIPARFEGWGLASAVAIWSCCSVRRGPSAALTLACEDPSQVRDADDPARAGQDQRLAPVVISASRVEVRTWQRQHREDSVHHVQEPFTCTPAGNQGTHAKQALHRSQPGHDQVARAKATAQPLIAEVGVGAPKTEHHGEREQGPRTERVGEVEGVKH